MGPAGLLAAGAGFLTIGLGLHSGTHGGVLLPVAMLVGGCGMGVAFSPLLTQSLVRVPAIRAADVSGLLTTTLQLSQVLGVAIFGTVFLTLARHDGPHASAVALSTTMGWLTVVLAVGAGTGALVARTVPGVPNPAPPLADTCGIPRRRDEPNTDRDATVTCSCRDPLPPP